MQLLAAFFWIINFASLVIAIAISCEGLSMSSWAQPFGAILGAFIGATLAAVLTNHFTKSRDKFSKKAELQKAKLALYHELCSRAAHCAFDYEAPWQFFGTTTSKVSRTLNKVVKFKPIIAVIYPMSGDVIGKLQPDTASAVVHFYNALGRWEREVIDSVHSLQEIKDEDGVIRKKVPAGDLRRLSRRLGETLLPAVNALEAMSREIGPDADRIIKHHFEQYYEYATPRQPQWERRGRIEPIPLLREFAQIARELKEKEQA